MSLWLTLAALSASLVLAQNKPVCPVDPYVSGSDFRNASSELTEGLAQVSPQTDRSVLRLGLQAIEQDS